MSVQPRTYVTGLSAEEKEERRKEQIRQAQLRYRESHGLVKPKLSEEEKVQLRKEKAHERYLKRRGGTTRGIPISYTVDYQRNYHKGYYEQNRDKLLGRAKTRYSQLRTCQESEEVALK